MSDAHEAFVTGEMRTWLAAQMPHAVGNLLSTVVERNILSGNWDDGPEVLDEDLEWLADELEQLAMRKLVPPVAASAITAAYVRDCISEVDWVDIALDYITKLVREKDEER